MEKWSDIIVIKTLPSCQKRQVFPSGDYLKIYFKQIDPNTFLVELKKTDQYGLELEKRKIAQIEAARNVSLYIQTSTYGKTKIGIRKGQMYEITLSPYPEYNTELIRELFYDESTLDHLNEETKKIVYL